jgi:glutathione S-transferase
VGERISQADIALSNTLLPLYQNVLGPETRQNFVHVNRWMATCLNQPQFVKVLGKVEFCTQDGGRKVGDKKK